MTHDPKQLWSDFRNAFVGELNDVSVPRLLEAWTSCSSRTHFYKQELLQFGVATRLNKGRENRLGFKCEELLIDYSYWTSGPNQTEIPLIFVESENNADSAEHEVGKLCEVNAPLRVLITCCEWDEEPGVWVHTSRDKYLTRWRQICADYESVYGSLHGIVALIVAEKQDTRPLFRLYTHWLGGDLIPDELDIPGRDISGMESSCNGELRPLTDQ